jgi:hypothetical protein
MRTTLLIIIFCLIPIIGLPCSDGPSGGNDGPTGSSGLDSGSVSQSSGDNSDMFDICQFEPFKDSKECKEKEGK